MDFLVYIVLALFILILVEKVLSKLLRVEKKKLSETDGKKMDRWGKGIILVLFLCTMPFYITKDIHIVKWYWMFYFTLSLGFQSLMEWKFLKDSKQYVITLIYLILCLILFYNVDFFINR